MPKLRGTPSQRTLRCGHAIGALVLAGFIPFVGRPRPAARRVPLRGSTYPLVGRDDPDATIARRAWKHRSLYSSSPHELDFLDHLFYIRASGDGSEVLRHAWRELNDTIRAVGRIRGARYEMHTQASRHFFDYHTENRTPRDRYVMQLSDQQLT